MGARRDTSCRIAPRRKQHVAVLNLRNLGHAYADMDAQQQHENIASRIAVGGFCDAE